MKPCLYLASQSPRRRELLQQIGVLHQVVSASVEESPLKHETAAEYVLRLARSKALAGLASVQASGLTIVPVLGADTVVVCDDDILEKPRDQAHAAAMLQRLSGRSHQVMTAVAMVSEDKMMVELSVTDVVFRELGDDEISAYWHTGEPQDKAGGYGIQGLGAVFVQQIRGSYTGVVGLPIEQTIILLKEFRLPWWQ